MRPLGRTVAFVAILFAFYSAALILHSQQRGPSQGSVQSQSQSQADRGRYLVEEVAKCSECHTPRDQNQQLDPDRWLQGAPTWIQPVFPMTNWAEAAPPLAGLPNLSDDQMERVLEMGMGVGDSPIQPPMHIYHMNRADAQAIIAYLRSLPPAREH